MGVFMCIWLCSACALYSYTVQDPQPKGWHRPQWAALLTPVNTIKMILINMFTGPRNGTTHSGQLSLPQVTLSRWSHRHVHRPTWTGYWVVKMTIKISYYYNKLIAGAVGSSKGWSGWTSQRLSLFSNVAVLITIPPQGEEPSFSTLHCFMWSAFWLHLI